MRDRVILFRGKRSNNGEWVYGSPIFQDGYALIRFWNSEEFEYEEYLVIPNTVGQYIGLKDKDGKKIFEGDIIDASDTWWDACGPAGHDSPIIEVEWSDEHCGFDPFANYDCDCGVYIETYGVEVIGNIYDNPELLKDGE